MQVVVERSTVEGFLKAPPSKSITHRALVSAGLAKGRSTIFSPSICDDTSATIEALKMLGTRINVTEDKLTVEGNRLAAPKREIFCGLSGTTLRFMTAVSALVGEECRLTGNESLMRRPMEPLLEALRQLGVKCYMNGTKISVKGKPRGGEVSIRGDVSSQFISALLLISPLIEGGTVINSQTEIQSEPYVFLTIDVQSKFGIEVKNTKRGRFEVPPQEYKTTTLNVEGDWSSASYILTAAALTGKVVVEGINLESLQADKAIINLMEKMGAKIKIDKKSITVERAPLKPTEFDVSNCPDLFPAACVLCSQANGISYITGVERL